MTPNSASMEEVSSLQSPDGRAETHRRHAKAAGKYVPRLSYDLALLLYRAILEDLVPMAVIGEFMTLLEDALAAVRPVLDHPGRDKEGRSQIMFRQKVEQAGQGAPGPVSAFGKITEIVQQTAVQHRIACRAVEIEGERHRALMVVGPRWSVTSG